MTQSTPLKSIVQGALEIKSVPVNKLKPYLKNARTHSRKQVGQIADSIREFGFNSPVLIDPSGELIAGHGRLKAAICLKMSHVPAVELGHLSDDQKRAFRLADNKIALNASWNLDHLRMELEALANQPLNLEVTGFSEQELDDLLAYESAIRNPDDAPALPDEPRTRRGDIWLLGSHRVLCGDGTSKEDLDRLLLGEKCHMVFTDPPYNVRYEGKTAARLRIENDDLGENFESFLYLACQVMLEACEGALYICMSSSELPRLHSAFLAAGGYWSTYIIWAKDRFTLGRSDYQRQYEPILYGWRDDQQHYWCGARNEGDVWTIARPSRNDVHPTMKPVELVERAIRNSSRRNESVLDPFGGSGSTLIACETTRRQARVVEIDPKYVDVIVRRWQEQTGQAAVREADQGLFDEVEPLRRAA